jgi:hypothetical protein
MRLREGQNDRLRVARCNTSCEARFTAGRNGNGPRRTGGIQNRGNFSPHPTKGPGARELGNQETTRQQLPTNSHAMTTLFLPAPSLMHTRGRPSVACLFQSSDDGHRLPVHRLSSLHRIGPAVFFFFFFHFSFHSRPCRQGSRVELSSAVC